MAEAEEEGEEVSDEIHETRTGPSRKCRTTIHETRHEPGEERVGPDWTWPETGAIEAEGPAIISAVIGAQFKDEVCSFGFVFEASIDGENWFRIALLHGEVTGLFIRDDVANVCRSGNYTVTSAPVFQPKAYYRARIVLVIGGRTIPKPTVCLIKSGNFGYVSSDDLEKLRLQRLAEGKDL